MFVSKALFDENWKIRSKKSGDSFYRRIRIIVGRIFGALSRRRRVKGVSCIPIESIRNHHWMIVLPIKLEELNLLPSSRSITLESPFRICPRTMIPTISTVMSWLPLRTLVWRGHLTPWFTRRGVRKTESRRSEMYLSPTRFNSLKMWKTWRMTRPPWRERASSLRLRW